MARYRIKWTELSNVYDEYEVEIDSNQRQDDDETSWEFERRLVSEAQDYIRDIDAEAFHLYEDVESIDSIHWEVVRLDDRPELSSASEEEGEGSSLNPEDEQSPKPRC